ncbi:hypothetical protein SAMN05216490_3465 [Mucilaginibacter mallensis]|uniref:Lanthionine synthetase C-like protein n=1 Tax=Mucilaginibacter mallensis TaxID=652787 RepID=A0A1H2ABP7_MUCMA|nr:hypothetical protein [Mucilaginibacter mallensis]SDT43391.1 hypothetical protein SAMN05216490_3465 [Mucilaginibacter mallensis]
MMPKFAYQNKPLLDKITNAFLVNSCYVENNSLNGGKMGIAVYFFMLSRYSPKQEYADFAFALLEILLAEEAGKEISPALDYFDGITGIGIWIIKLIEQDFFEADRDEILTFIDNRIFDYIGIINKSKEISILDSISICFYLQARLKDKTTADQEWDMLVITEHLIIAIEEIKLKISGMHSINYGIVSAYLKILLRNYEAQIYEGYSLEKINEVIDLNLFEQISHEKDMSVEKLLFLSTVFDIAKIKCDNNLKNKIFRVLNNLELKGVQLSSLAFRESQIFRYINKKFLRQSKQDIYKYYENELKGTQYEFFNKVHQANYSFSDLTNAGIAIFGGNIQSSFMDEHIYLMAV